MYSKFEIYLFKYSLDKNTILCDYKENIFICQMSKRHDLTQTLHKKQWKILSHFTFTYVPCDLFKI